MVVEPEKYFESFAGAGAEVLTIHQEAAPHLHRQLHKIRELGCKAGAAVNPSTPVESLRDVVGDLDLLLVMTVNPGFGGQTFIPRSLEKIRAVRALLDAAGNPAPVEVDGGIDPETAASVVAAGAEMLVAGQAIFGTAHPEQAVRDLRAAALRAPSASS
jgi:ribulose-phosphate 3-epimerase